MNKTVSINLGGFFFHIDEDAYRKLNHYLDAIRRSLSPDGKDEIMADIEGRIAELLSEKIKNDKQVVGNKEIEEVIAVMGQPEDYKIDEDEPKSANSSSTNSAYNPYYAPKKLFRDADKNIIAGVCAGLGHYVRIDPIWIRILFIVSPFVTFGTSLFIYVLLWVLIPKAITTTEKLQMKGEPINISNIEKKVKEEFTILQDKLHSVDYDKIGSNVKTGAERLGNGISTVVLGILKAFAKILGALITVFSALGLGGVVVLLIMFLFTSTLVHQSWYPHVEGWNFTETPLWLLTLVTFFAIAIPLFAFFILGLRILVDTMKPVSNLVTYTLLAIWIVCISACIYLGLYQAAQLGTEGRTFVKKEFAIKKNDTLQVIFKNNEYFTKYNDYNHDTEIKQDSSGNEVLYSNNVRFYVRRTDEPVAYIQVEKIARASNIQQAGKIAERIKYNFRVKGNSLILDNYLISDLSSKFRAQRVEIFLYLPEGTYFKPDANVQKYDDSDDAFFNLYWDNATHVYQMKKSRVECLTCPPDDMGIPEGEVYEGETPVGLSEEEQKIIMQDQAKEMEHSAEEMRKSAEELKEQAKQMEQDAKQLRNNNK
ncbi:phage-shock protein [Flavobacterium akiainvivens]|uniref:Phage-shock protein n=1 Tax=Flavobacterium akiainvivens TaxID=1202724 RepID=A0A0M9VGL8_9FLAO|nr:PspC domain-containing protein [Flavobacterium akiainvivens]KOS04619.1 phage-shock protein [Flavobacterium akiainvivens]SFQ65765.1 phage shock protein C (PspC) family protein [Flavobacterium akiainvivens]